MARTRRAWLLLLLSALAPGSAQIVAGSRRLGRRALAVTLAAWALVLVLVLVYLLHRQWVFALVLGRVTSVVGIILLVLAALFWAVMFLDTVRLIRPRLLAQGMRPLFAIGCVLLLVASVGGLGYSAYLVGVGRGAVGGVFGSGKPFDPVDGRYNFLMMGGDAGADRVGLRPDSMTVFSVDAKTGQAVTISLPRNTQNVPFPKDSPLHQLYPDGYDCGDECILNSIYTDVTNDHKDLYPHAKDPGAEAMKDAAEGVTGLKIQAYVLVDMDGFSQLIDAMGGIDVNVGGRVPIGGGHNEITGEKNPIDGYIEPGRQHLDGYHALWFGRSREGASDFEREARQRCVQSAMIKQLDPMTLLTKFKQITDAGQQIIETDIPEQQLSSFVDLALQAKDHPLIQYGMGPPYYETLFPTYPDFDQFHHDISRVLKDSEQGKTPEPMDSSSAQAGGPSLRQGHGGPSDGQGQAAVRTAAEVVPAAPSAPTRGAVSAQAQHAGHQQVQLVADDEESNGTCSVP